MSAPTWDDFAELALKRITSSGAEYGDIRIVHSTSQTIRGEDRRIASIRDNDDDAFIQGKQGMRSVRPLPNRPAPIVIGIALPGRTRRMSRPILKASIAPCGRSV